MVGEARSMKSGTKPIPTRWKGFYRALKRNEEWAIKLKGNFEVTSLPFLMKWAYAHPAKEGVLNKMIYAENPLIKMIKKQDSYEGKYIPIPLVIYEDKK